MEGGGIAFASLRPQRMSLRAACRAEHASPSKRCCGGAPGGPHSAEKVVSSTESGQTLQGSFSAVSKRNFASKYALESSRRDLL